MLWGWAFVDACAANISREGPPRFASRALRPRPNLARRLASAAECASAEHEAGRFGTDFGRGWVPLEGLEATKQGPLLLL